MNIFVTSDLHLNHQRICELANRPFSSVEQMNEAIICAWNSVVQPDDWVYVLGDFAMGQRHLVPIWRSRLNGHIVLVKGNHDVPDKWYCQPTFDSVVSELQFFYNGILVAMAHHPTDVFDKFVLQPDVMLCGHVHNAWSEVAKGDKIPVDYHGTNVDLPAPCQIVNVGVDVRGWAPVLLSDLLVKSGVFTKTKEIHRCLHHEGMVTVEER